MANSRSLLRSLLICAPLAVAGCNEMAPEAPVVLTGWFSITSQGELDAMRGVEFIEGSLRIEGRNQDPEDPLRDLSPLRDLVSVSQTFRIDDVDMVDTLEPLKNLRSVGGNFFVGNNDNIHTLRPLRSLSHCGGTIYVHNSDRLKDLDGLQGLVHLSNASLSIVHNDSLTTLSGLDSLTRQTNDDQYISRQIRIAFNPRLTSLAGLGNLVEVSKLLIHANDALTIVSDLESLESAELISVLSNPSLCESDVLDWVSSVQVTVSNIGGNAECGIVR